MRSARAAEGTKAKDHDADQQRRLSRTRLCGLRGRGLGEGQRVDPLLAVPGTAPAGAPNVVVMLMTTWATATSAHSAARSHTPRWTARGARRAADNYPRPRRVLAGAGRAAHRAEPAPGGFRLRARTGPRLPELRHGAGRGRPDPGGESPRRRLRHLRRGQVAPDARSNACTTARRADSWPMQRGFDRYYGCLEGFTTFFHPHRLMRDNSPLAVDRLPGGLLPDRRPHRPGARDDQGAAGPRPGQAVLPLLRPPRGARPAAGQASDIADVPGPLRRRLGPASATSASPGSSSSGCSPPDTRCAPRNPEPGSTSCPGNR